MYTVYVIVQKRPIDYSEPLKPTKIFRFKTYEEARAKSQEEQDLFFNRVGDYNYSILRATMKLFYALSKNTGEFIHIEIVEN